VVSVERRLYALILIIAIVGVGINYYVQHYQGGEIYEAANRAFNLVKNGFNVTVTIESVDGKIFEGELFSISGSTIYVVKNGKRFTVGGPSARLEDVKAKKIEIHVKGKVYVYELPPIEGKFHEAIAPYKVPAYSERFSGLIYVKGDFDALEFGKLKYDVDYLTYGSIDVKQPLGEGVIISANFVPISMLEEHLGDKEIYMYGTLYVNSDERNLGLRLLEVRTQ